MPLKANSNSSILHSKEHRANYSTSFVLTTTGGGFALDTCPKCGQNICEHTSLADVIHLPNSVSQDFSTYSSDSSLIKQLFSESTHSNATIESIDISNLDINDLNKLKFAKLLRINPPYNYNNLNSNSKTIRPVSCQVMLIDQETTDKLLKDFYDASKTVVIPTTTTSTHAIKSIQLSSSEEPNTPTNESAVNVSKVTQENETTSKSAKNKNSKDKSAKKKPKFPNFRLFLKRDNTQKHHLLVNCLTSSGSSSSSSCEDIKYNTIVKKPPLKAVTATTAAATATTAAVTATATAATFIAEQTSKTMQAVETIAQKATDVIPSTRTATTALRHTICKSIMSINSKTIDELNDYNELHAIELCPIVGPNDIDEDYYAYEQIASIISQEQVKNCEANTTNHVPLERKNIFLLTTTCRKENLNLNSSNKTVVAATSTHFSLNSTSTDSNTEITQLERTNLKKKNDSDTSRPISLTSTNSSSCTADDKNDNDNQNDEKISLNDDSMGFFTSHHSQMCITCNKLENLLLNGVAPPRNQIEASHNSYNNNINKKQISPPPVYSETVTNTNTKKSITHQHQHANRMPFFSSCSSCDNNNQQSSKRNKNKKRNKKMDNNSLFTLDNLSMAPIKYHSISVIFMLVGLFTLNFLQETMLLVYYFSSEQFYWFVYSLIALFTGQILTLILTLLSEIDLVNLAASAFAHFDFPKSAASSSSSSPGHNNNKCRNKDGTTASSSTTTNTSVSSSPRQQLLLSNNVEESGSSSCNSTISEQEQEYLLTSYNTELYKIFKSPFSKLLLMVPGYLPLAVYIQFFRLLFNYRKAASLSRFRHEFQLALHMFLNALFYSLPLAILNSCYLASIVKSNKSFLTWYTTSFLSTLSTREFFSTITTSFTNAFYFQQHHDKSSAAGSSSSSSSESTAMYVDIERKSQFLYFLISVFVSVSVGICLYTAYYELMKQIHSMALLKNTRSKLKSGTSNNLQREEAGFLLPVSSRRFQHTSAEEKESESKLKNLGLIEILVYFCYKFCLITSRLSILALFWYLFNEWLLFAVMVHIFLCYLSMCCTSVINNGPKSDGTFKAISIFSTQNLLKDYKKLFNQRKLNNSVYYENEAGAAMLNSGTKSSFLRSSSSKINQHLTLFIVCLLSFIDLFVNQMCEFCHLKKCILYYIVFFAQNLTILTFWLVKTILGARLEQENALPSLSSPFVEHGENKSNFYFNTKMPNGNSLLNMLIKSTIPVTNSVYGNDIEMNSDGIFSAEASTVVMFSPATYACYATLIYLCIILFTIFGLILKFLHLHILRKRYRKMCEDECEN